MIPGHLLLPGDLVDVLDKVTKLVHRMHATDAKHAVQSDPKRWAFHEEAAKPKRKAKRKSKPKAKPRRKK